MNTIATLLAVIFVLFALIFFVARNPTERDLQVRELDTQQEALIQSCYKKGGVPSIGYRAMGFPKHYMQRCDFPTNQQ